MAGLANLLVLLCCVGVNGITHVAAHQGYQNCAVTDAVNATGVEHLSLTRTTAGKTQQTPLDSEGEILKAALEPKTSSGVTAGVLRNLPLLCIWALFFAHFSRFRQQYVQSALQ